MVPLKSEIFFLKLIFCSKHSNIMIYISNIKKILFTMMMKLPAK